MKYVVESSSVRLVAQKDLNAITDKVEQAGKKKLPGTRGQQEARKQKRPSPKAWHLVLVGGDGLLFVALLAVVLMLTPHLHLAFSVSVYRQGTWDTKFVWGCTALFSWIFAAKVTQAQDSINASGRLASVLHVLFALAFTFLIWMALTFPLNISGGISYFQLSLCFLALAAPALCIWRVILAEIIISPRFRTRAVIVGANIAGLTLAKELLSAKRPRIIVLGYIHEGADERLEADVLPIVGGRSTLRSLLRDGVVDLIITAIDYQTHPELFQEAIEGIQMGIQVVPMPVAYESICGKLPVEHIGDQWYATLPSQNIVSLLYICWNKLIDILCGVCGMAALLLILPIIAILIRLDSPGPIFYHQERLGYRGRKFTIHKFRSMHVDAEFGGQATWAREQDPRVTRVGRFLRATHLDELPQVFNILRGQMSVIGPRPERQEFTKDLEETIPFYRCRLMVKPGLTGWAQVKFLYASTDQESLVKSQYDLYYIRHQSFMLDISIILQTVGEVFFHRGR